MERKRASAVEDDGPEAKHVKGEKSGDKRENGAEGGGGEVNPKAPFSAPFLGEEGKDESEEWGKVILLQRSQLTEKTKDQAREIERLNRKIEEVEKRLIGTESDTAAAVFHMTSVQEDMTLTLARLGAGGEDVEADETPSDVASAVLRGEGGSGIRLEKLAAKCDATKRLLAQVVVLLEDGIDSSKEPDSTKAREKRKGVDELHAELIRTKDELNTVRVNEVQLQEKMHTLEADLADRSSELVRRRNQIARLKSDLSAAPNNARAELERNNSFGGRNASTDKVSAEGELEELKTTAKNLREELEIELKRRKELAEKLETANQERDAPSTEEILGSALYQTMEANLQQLVLLQRQWERERANLVGERDTLIATSHEALESERENYERRIELLEKQLTETVRAAEQAKAARDKFSLQYESRKLDTGAEEKMKYMQERVTYLEDKNKKAEQRLADLKETHEVVKKRMEDAESKLAAGITVTEASVVEQLRKDLESEKENAESFIEELESMSTLEEEKLVLRQQLAEKKEAFAKAKADKLTYRQELISIKEENKTMQLKLKAEEEQSKSLQALLASSKKLVQETQNVSSRQREEVQILNTKLEKWKQVAEAATEKSRQANAETDELKRSKNAAQNRAIALSSDLEQERYNVKRQEELAGMLQKKLHIKKEESERGDSNVEFSKEELLREYQKIRNCSVKTDKKKEVVLLRCGHLFSQQCVDDLVSARNRKCPICGKNFSHDEVRPIYFS